MQLLLKTTLLSQLPKGSIWLKERIETPASLEVRQAGRRTLNTLSGSAMGVSTVTILHYNDVYNVEPRVVEPVGGAARFCAAIKTFSHLNPLVLFSGDIFSPSMHFGLEVLSEWVSQTKFPWLMSNVIDQETGRPLGDGRITHVVDWSGKRIGLIGLVEQEWLDTLATINPDEVTFLDYIEVGRKLGAQLKEEGCDYVIALTHMRTPNDIRLAENVNEIDLILGGHDHVYEIKQVHGKYIIKSGTDFRQFSKVTLSFDKMTVDVSVEEINVTSSMEEDSTLKLMLEQFTGLIEGKMDDVLGSFTVPLDGRFESVRRGETNLGNWVCDVVLACTGADLVIMNSGTFRSDTVHAAGPFTLRDLVTVIPMMDPLVVLSVTEFQGTIFLFVDENSKWLEAWVICTTEASDVIDKLDDCISPFGPPVILVMDIGQDILNALENGVSQYPKLEGRFPQVAGISFAFDPHKPKGKRVDPNFVRIGDEYLVTEQRYRLATKTYLHSGCDGYTMLKDAKVLVDEEECPELGLAVQNHFKAIDMRLGKTRRHSKHRQSLVTLSRRHSLIKMLDTSTDLDGPPPLRRSNTMEVGGTGMRHSPPQTHPSHSPHSAQPQRGGRLMRRASLDDLEQESCQLSPKLEGRIVILTDEKREELLLERQRLEEDSVIQEVDDECSPQGSIDQS
uniref:5'-Nucleotidase C-terminal domain-containing protein n=1 Tax=Timema cristinae TaxID=61476 RepID=A0A7R9GVU3_TIMCR|nr:unnamed protein product [Timema cristinae]